ANDGDGDTITLAIDWDNNPATPVDTRTIAPPYTTPIIYTSPANYNNPTLSSVAMSIPVTVTDGVNPVAPYTPPLSFTLGPNRAPVVGGTPALAANNIPSPASFTLLQGTATATDPEGDAVSFTVTNNQDASAPSGQFPFGSLGPYTAPPVYNVIFTVYANDPLHAGTNGSAYPPITANVQCVANTLLWQATFDTGMDGFVFGQNYSPVLPNIDDQGASAFARCAVLPYMGSGFSGSCLTTGGDAGNCAVNPSNYGAHCFNNVVSPIFSLAGKNNAKVVFNAVRNGKTGSGAARYRVYVSTNGSSWTQLLNELGGNVIPNTTLNQEVSLASVAGQPTVRLRFEFWDNGSAIFNAGAGTYAGWSIDDVRLYACP
ncbi:MAG TPA: hypothetical protein VEI97_08430, partial [bacterium]|nr:hypothetical protein [bacterium]